MNSKNHSRDCTARNAPVWLGNCSGIFPVPEEQLRDYYLGYGIVVALAFGCTLIIVALSLLGI